MIVSMFQLATSLLALLHLQCLTSPTIAALPVKRVFAASPALEVDAYLSPFIASYPAIPGCHASRQNSSSRSPGVPLVRRLQASSILELADDFACRTKEDVVDGGGENSGPIYLRATSDKHGKVHQESCKAPRRRETSREEEESLDHLANLVLDPDSPRDAAGVIRALQASRPEGQLLPPRVQRLIQIFLGDLSITSVAGVTAIGLCVWAEMRKEPESAPEDALTGEPLTGYPNLGHVLCRCQARSSSERGKCHIVRSAMLALGCIPATGDKYCPFEGGLPFPHVKKALSLPLKSFESTPRIIPAEVITTEAATYRNLFSAGLELNNRVGKHPCRAADTQGDDGKDKPILEGWTELLAFIAIEEGFVATRQRLPLAVLAQRQNEEDASLTDYLVVTRGTATEGEWRLNFSFDQILGELLDFPGGVHRGFASIALVLWPAIQTILGKAIREGRLGYVTVSGHSLGGGVSSILSYIIGSYVPKHNPKLNGVTTRAVLFAPPLSGSPSFMASLSSTVNLRSIVAELDPIVALPCDEMTECTEGRDSKGKKLLYSSYAGRIVIGARYLGYPWTDEEESTNAMAWHTCSYACWASKLTKDAGLTADLYACNAPVENRLIAAHQCGSLSPISAEQYSLRTGGVSGQGNSSDEITRVHGTGQQQRRGYGEGMMGGVPFTFELDGLTAGGIDATAD